MMERTAKQFNVNDGLVYKSNYYIKFARKNTTKRSFLVKEQTNQKAILILKCE